MKDVVVYKPKKWVRSREGWVAGIFEGIGRSYGIEPNLLRLIWIVSVFGFGTGFILYPLMIYLMPREDELEQAEKEKFLGVCSRVSQKMDIELPLVRLAAFLGAFASLGTFLLVYLALYFLMPNHKREVFF